MLTMVYYIFITNTEADTRIQNHFPISTLSLTIEENVSRERKKQNKTKQIIVHVDLTTVFISSHSRVGFVPDLGSEVISDVTGVVADFVLDHQRDVGGHGQRHLRRKRSRFAEKVEVAQSEC